MSRRILAIGAGAAIAIVLLWFLLLWRPQSSRLDEATSRRDAAEAKNGELTLRVDELEDLERRRPELEAQKDELEAAIPAEADLGEFLLQADEAADAADVRVTSIAPSPPALNESAGGPTVVALTIDVQGGYFEVLDYLNRLDRLPRLVVTDDVGLAPAGEGGSDDALTASLTARMFTSEAPAAEPGAEGTTDTTAPAGETTTTTAAASS